MANAQDYSETTFTLKNGQQMPAVGLGTKDMRKYLTLYKTLDSALECGYRLFDTATTHGNENLLGKAFRELLPKHGLERSDVFFTTKYSPVANDVRLVARAFERSLKNLDTEYIDLYLLQYPSVANADPKSSHNATSRPANWLAITELYEQSKIKAIGVSNFSIAHLKELIDVFACGPVVHQIEWHPFYYQRDMLQFCAKNNIRVQAYSSFGGMSKGNNELLQDPVVNEVAKRHEVSAAQVLLMWSLQQGVAVIPNSSKPEHIRQNIQLDFRLSENEMAMLDALGAKNRKYGWDPTLVA